MSRWWIFLIFFITEGSAVSIRKTEEQCVKKHELTREVRDNVSPWILYYFECRNTEPDFYWAAECEKGSCINPYTNVTFTNYSILPIYKKIYFRMRGSDSLIMSREVIVACKCVPNDVPDDDYEYGYIGYLPV